jgi:Pro-kumamolisin, activation domain/Bacterial Ig-like domain (group 3)
MRLLRTLPVCLFAASFLLATQVSAQRVATAPRITEAIDENQRVTLTGNTHPAANPRNDLGRVSPTLPMTNLILVLRRNPDQQAAFDDFVAAQYDSSSPDFHHWLMPAEVGERFGPSLTDVATISNWLSGHGFGVAEVSKDRMSIHFGGTAAQVESTFHTEIHNLSVNGEKHIANMSDPQIPAALAPVVTGVKALHNFFPRPLHRLGGVATLNKDTGKWQRVKGAALPQETGKTKLAPEFTITVGTGSSAYTLEDVTPYDFATIYNVLPLWNASTPINGTGQIIAVAGTSDINPTDVATFRSSFGLPAGLPPIQVQGANGLDPGVCNSSSSTCGIEDLVENSLDVEWSGAVATGAQIVLVTSGQLSSTDDTVYDSSSYVIENVDNTASPLAGARILNVSYGACELAEGTSGNAAYNNLWQTGATEGVAVFVASGDAGSAACDQGLDSSVPYAAQYGLSVSGLASTPYNTAVGGTDFNWCNVSASTPCPPTPYWSATNNATTGASAAGYVPEIIWDNTCTNPQILPYVVQVLVPYLKSAGYSPTSPTDAETSCQFFISWDQTIYNLSQVDFSSFVDIGGGGGGVSSCTTSDGATVASCTGGYAKPSWQAGVTGIPADGKRDLPDVSFFASNGFLNSAYLICVSEAGSACTYSSTTENAYQEVGGTSVASPAMAGVMALINQKAGGPQGSPNAELYALAAKQTYPSCSSETVTSGSASCYFNDVDEGTNAMPCAPTTPNCTVLHTGDTVAVLSGYSATAGYDQSSGLGSLNVANVVNGWTATGGTGKVTISVAPSASTISVNQSLNVVVTVAATGTAPTGTVSLVGPGYDGGVQTVASGGLTFAIPADSLTGGTDALSANYSGDSNYAQANNSASVTVTKLTPTVSATASATSISASASLTVTGTVSTSATGAPTPTGTVTLTSGGYTSSATALSGGNYSITIPGNSLTAGSDTITATYNGSGFYATATNTATVTVTAVSATYSVTASTPTAVAPGGSTTSTVTVATSTAYAGSVQLTCALTSSPAGATDVPTCSITAGSPVTLTSSATSVTATATVLTTAATSGALTRPELPGRRLAGGATTVLALLVFLGIPARRRAWRAMLGLVVLLVALGSLAACGGGGGGGGGGGTTNPGTTAGSYTFTVTGTGSPAVSPAPTSPFTVTVN